MGAGLGQEGVGEGKLLGSSQTPPRRMDVTVTAGPAQLLGRQGEGSRADRSRGDGHGGLLGLSLALKGPDTWIPWRSLAWLSDPSPQAGDPRGASMEWLGHACAHASGLG